MRRFGALQPLGLRPRAAEHLQGGQPGHQVGEVTGPVKTDFGYHLILVKETRVAEKPTLDQLRDELAQQVENAAITAKIDELTKGATVTRDGEGLDPAILKNSALID
jgi:peptidyl-prolyl cis-trans isomerase C